MTTPAFLRQTQWFRMMWLTLPLPTVIVTLMAWNSGDPHLRLPVALAWGVCTVGLLSLGRLAIELHGDRLAWTFGFLGWPSWQLALADIAQMQCVRTSFWRGAGIKPMGKDKLFNVSIGGTALRLTLKDGRILTLGTPEPERLAALIEARRPKAR